MVDVLLSQILQHYDIALFPQLQRSGQPYLPRVCNICCLLAFLLALPLPLHLPVHLDEAVVISLASCVMLLSQPDGLVIPHSSKLFLAPSLALSSTTLYTISMFTVLSQLTLVNSLSQLETAGRV